MVISWVDNAETRSSAPRIPTNAILIAIDSLDTIPPLNTAKKQSTGSCNGLSLYLLAVAWKVKLLYHLFCWSCHGYVDISNLNRGGTGWAQSPCDTQTQVGFELSSNCHGHFLGKLGPNTANW